MLTTLCTLHHDKPTWLEDTMCTAQITGVCLHIGKPTTHQHTYTYQHCRALTPDRNGKGQNLMKQWCKQSCSKGAARAVHSRLIPPVAYQTSSGCQSRELSRLSR